jgi:hypothetical protein
MIAVLLAIPALANEFDHGLKGELDTTIIHVSTGGLWKGGDNYGNWRLVVRNHGWEHTRSFLYLQWLKTYDKEKEVKEIKTVQITEFNTGDWRNVLNVEYRNDVFIIYYVLRGRDGFHHSILKPALPGKYKISIAGNIASAEF